MYIYRLIKGLHDIDKVWWDDEGKKEQEVRKA